MNGAEDKIILLNSIDQINEEIDVIISDFPGNFLLNDSSINKII